LFEFFFFIDEFVKKLGKGSFGSVYLYVDLKTGNPCAIKEIKSSKSGLFGEELGYVLKLNSQYLVKYYDMFELDNNLYVVMEYFENGNLGDMIKKQREKKEKMSKGVFLIFVLIY
jgi:serine/threonine protein kinase